MRSAGQEAVVRVVARTDVRVRQAGNNREVLAEFLDDLQVWRKLVVLSGLLREERGRMQTQRRVDADNAPWRLGRRRGAVGFQERKRQGDAGGTEERAAGEV